MALIKCNECGQMVSDKAGSCPNCGCPVEKRIVCEECGAIISAGQSICPNCGSPCGCSTSADANQKQGQGTREVNLTLLDLQLTKTGVSGRGRMPFAIFALIPISSILGLHWFHIGKTGTAICNILIYALCWPIAVSLFIAAFDSYEISYFCVFFGILFILPPIILFFLTFFIGIRAIFMPQEQFEEQYVNSYSFFPL